MFCAKIQCPFRKHYRAFLHYLEEAEPKIASHTSYMRNMYKHVLKVVETLENCGYEKLITFCHGDAKPNNFLFRSIEIDIEDLECEGLQSILIDWQGGFLGSAANDLMWALFPFLEAHTEDKVLRFWALNVIDLIMRWFLLLNNNKKKNDSQQSAISYHDLISNDNHLFSYFWTLLLFNMRRNVLQFCGIIGRSLEKNRVFFQFKIACLPKMLF